MEARAVSGRVKKIFAAADRDEHLKTELDVILFRNGTEPHLDLGFFYVTGLVSGLYEGSTAVCHPDGHLDGMISPLEESSARRAGGFRIHVPGTRTKESKVLPKLVGRAKVVGINAQELTHAGFRRLKKLLPRAKFVDVSGAVLEARMIKDETELANLTSAARIASRVAERIPRWLKPGVRENEVAAEMAYYGGRLGAQGSSFETIAAFGANAAEPHYTELSARLRRGQFALFDFGFKYHRYCSDITRTFFVGRPRPKDRRMYETVRHAQEVALDLLRAGANGRDLHQAAERVIDRTEFKNRFIHGLGHGVGLAVHDGGSLNGSSDFTLKAGMVVTVEPGVYVPRYGGVRIEDDVLVTPRGYRSLTTAPREFQTI